MLFLLARILPCEIGHPNSLTFCIYHPCFVLPENVLKQKTPLQRIQHKIRSWLSLHGILA